MPDTRVLEGLLKYGEDVEEIVSVSRIFGMDPGARECNPDWTLCLEEFRDDPDRLRYHKEKIDLLLRGDPERRKRPIRESDLVDGLGPNYRTLHLIQVDGLYFIGSGGVHRVAVAKQLGFKRLKAVVTPAEFKAYAPKAAREWVASFRPEGREATDRRRAGRA